MAANRIHLIGNGRYDEDRVGVIFTPGHLIEVYLDTTRKVRKHSTEGGWAECLWALEDANQGNEIDDDFVVAELAPYIIAAKGDVIYAFIKVGEDIAIGDHLISGGDGTLIEADGTEKQVLAIAEEAMDLTGSGAVATRVAVRVL